MAAEPMLVPRPLTPGAFSAFGTVVEAPGDAGSGQAINAGTTQRFELLQHLDLTRHNGRGVLALYRSQPRAFPLHLRELERHALGMQAFVPLQGQRFVVVVAPAGDTLAADAVQAFVTNGRQGVVLNAGTWHHPLLALDGGDYLVLERRGDTVDCEVLPLPTPLLLALRA
jgi:ureidoglycolate lyase